MSVRTTPGLVTRHGQLDDLTGGLELDRNCEDNIIDRNIQEYSYQSTMQYKAGRLLEMVTTDQWWSGRRPGDVTTRLMVVRKTT